MGKAQVSNNTGKSNGKKQKGKVTQAKKPERKKIQVSRKVGNISKFLLIFIPILSIFFLFMFSFFTLPCDATFLRQTKFWSNRCRYLSFVSVQPFRFHSSKYLSYSMSLKVFSVATSFNLNLSPSTVFSSSSYFTSTNNNKNNKNKHNNSPETQDTKNETNKISKSTSAAKNSTKESAKSVPLKVEASTGAPIS